MNKLTAKQLLLINHKLTDGAPPAPTLMRRLETISQLPYRKNEDASYVYKSTIDRVSVLGCSIAKLKPFEKKNCQTAIVAILALLELNGIELENYEDSVAVLAEHLSSGNVSASSKWIRQHQREDKRKQATVLTDDEPH